MLLLFGQLLVQQFAVPRVASPISWNRSMVSPCPRTVPNTVDPNIRIPVLNARCAIEPRSFLLSLSMYDVMTEFDDVSSCKFETTYSEKELMNIIQNHLTLNSYNN